MRTFLTLTILLIAALSIMAAVPTTISYQGQLTDTGGNPVTNGAYSVSFNLYDSPVAVTPLWGSGVQQVIVTNGLFSYNLGESVTLPSDLFGNNSNVWLGVTVGTDSEISPRSPITSSPIAAVALSVNGDVRTTPGSLIMDAGRIGPGVDSTIVITSEANAIDHHGHVTILKVAGGGADTTNLVSLFGDPDFINLTLGDGNDIDSSVVVQSAVDHKHRGHVTVLKVAGGGTDTTNMVSLFGDPDFARVDIGDDSKADSGIVISSIVDNANHNGHITVLKISNNGFDTTEVIGLFGDPDFARIDIGDGSSVDSSIVISSAVNDVDHRGHVTILKIANNGFDTTGIIGLFGDPDFARVEIGDNSSTDSGIVLTNAVNGIDHKGHVTILKIANGGIDTTNLVGLFGDPDFINLTLGDGNDFDSGVVVQSAVDHKHRGHVTILKISNGGTDTTNGIESSVDSDGAYFVMSDSLGDSAITFISSAGARHGENGGIIKSPSKVAKFKAGAALAKAVNKTAADGREGAYMSLEGDLMRAVEILVDSVSSNFIMGDTLHDTTIFLHGDRGGNGRILVIANNNLTGLPKSHFEVADWDADGLLDLLVDGDVGIGTATPLEKLHVIGNICYTGSIAACSDRRYKNNITDLSGSLSKVLQMQGITYKWKQDEYPNQNFDGNVHLGFIAQDVEQLFPEMVLTDKNGYKSVDYGRLTPVLVEAIKEQQQQIDELKKLVQQLAAKSTDGNSSYGMK